MNSSRLMKYFEQYVKNYDMNNINVKVKYFHCLKMMELCRDIATSLNTVGIMSDLRRIRQGKFNIEESVTIDNINENSLIDIVDVLDYKKVELTSDKEKEVLNGAIIDNIYNSDEVLFVSGNEAVALYKKYDKDSKKLKPYKMFKGGVL